MCGQAEEKHEFHVMAKPVGAECNLKCGYCFYLEKEAILSPKKKSCMSDEVLETYVREYITSQDAHEISFVWQGGEPMLAGLDFYRKAIRLQKKYARHGKNITNALQTNGTLLNDEWCLFLAENSFIVGISLDGPKDVHDRYRVDRGGKPTFDRVMNGIKLLKKYGVEFNVLACVTRESSGRAVEIYRFFKNAKIDFIQFTPLVERLPNAAAENLGLHYAVPPVLNEKEPHEQVTSFSVRPEAWGEFMIAVFDEWVRNDVGSTWVMNFESALANWMKLAPASCVFGKHCGRSTIIEHNGDIYSCDHYVYPEYRLGNVLDNQLEELINSEKQIEFGECKETMLPETCRECEVLFACRGECPKHRFSHTWNGEPGLNYLCNGYRNFFRHIHPYMKGMAQLINVGVPADRIMDAVDAPLVVQLVDRH